MSYIDTNRNNYAKDSETANLSFKLRDLQQTYSIYEHWQRDLRSDIRSGGINAYGKDILDSYAVQIRTNRERLNILSAEIKDVRKRLKNAQRDWEKSHQDMLIANWELGFREFPGETSLLLNVAGCPNHCEGCHSEYLRLHKGTPIDDMIRWPNDRLIFEQHYTCIGIMGDGGSFKDMFRLMIFIKKFYKEQYNKDIKFGWYTGKDYADFSENGIAKYFDYVKIGHYDEKYGPLDCATTNQIMLKQTKPGVWENITKQMLPKTI